MCPPWYPQDSLTDLDWMNAYRTYDPVSAAPPGQAATRALRRQLIPPDDPFLQQQLAAAEAERNPLSFDGALLGLEDEDGGLDWIEEGDEAESGYHSDPEAGSKTAPTRSPRHRSSALPPPR